VVDPDTEITITPGATYGIYNAFATILSPGDEAILFEPAYDSYIPNIQVTGATAVCIPLQVPGFNIDWDLVKAAITPKTKAIIVNTPHNPCGSIWTAEDRQQLADLVRDTEIVVISDEVYEQLVFDGSKHYSVLEHEELRARSFIIFSFGKVFNNTGWKIGYTIAPPSFTRAYRMLHQYTAFSVNTPSQYAIAMHLASGLASDVRETMENKRNLFLDLMKYLPFTVNKPTIGSYFQVVGYSQISELPDLEFAKWLTREYGVATIPISAFYQNRKDDHLIRFCFAKKDETLIEACDRLARLK
jgi:methionine aminotransferase